MTVIVVTIHTWMEPKVGLLKNLGSVLSREGWKSRSGERSRKLYMRRAAWVAPSVSGPLQTAQHVTGPVRVSSELHLLSSYGCIC